MGTPSNFVIVSKEVTDEETMRAAVDGLVSEYGDGILLFENDYEYTVMVPGAYPYDVFETLFKTAE